MANLLSQNQIFLNFSESFSGNFSKKTPEKTWVDYQNLEPNFVAKLKKSLPFYNLSIQQNQVSRSIGLAKKIFHFSLISSLIFIQSCSGGAIDPFDYDTGLTRSEAFETITKKDGVNGIKKKKADKEKADAKKSSKSSSGVPIPKMSKLIVSPPPPVVGGDKIISFSVTDQVPLKDALIEFGRMTSIDVDIDPKISGNIILNAKNRPIKEVIDRIATLGNLRYSYKNGVLYFESDSPYIKNYQVDYLSDGVVWDDVETNLDVILRASSTAGSESSDSDESSAFSSNKSAGIISIFGTKKQHEAAEKYLDEVEKYSSSQVLIEAKVIEVTLNKEFSSGINWSRIKGNFISTNGYATGSAVDLILEGSEFTAYVNALEQFGSTKTISSPRINAINNQKATLNFTDKLVYFQVQQTQSNTSTTGGSTAVVAQTISSSKLEESVGVILEIVPSINLNTNEVTMSIKPTLSVLSDYVVDPASPAGITDAEGKKVVNEVPVIQSREIDTLAKVQSGNVLVIGGLMKDQSSSTDSGIPLLARIPILGWLFKSMSRESGITETVIFIKATIINSGTPVGKIDRDIQENFDPSKRSYF